MSADVTIVTTATVTVFDTGSLYETAIVQAGIGGPILTVTGVTGPSQITVQNLTGMTVEVPAGTRIILLSSRPTAYQDPLGIQSIGSTVIADSGGSSRVFLPEGRYDAVITDPADPAITVSARTQATISSGQTLTMSSTVAADQDILIVAIAWQEPLAIETLDSVTCNGDPMTRLGAALNCDVFYLLNPTAGAKTIEAMWSGSSTKAAVGEAFTVSNANVDRPIGAVAAPSGSGTLAGVSAAGVLSGSLAICATAVNTAPGTTTVTLVSGSTSLWDQSAGSTGAMDRTQAVGASRSAYGDPDLLPGS